MTRTFFFSKRNFVKLKFLKFLVCRLNMLRLKTFSFLNAILKIKLIEKYLPITMPPPQLFRELHWVYPSSIKTFQLHKSLSNFSPSFHFGFSNLKLSNFSSFPTTRTGQRINDLESGPSSYQLKRNFLVQIAWVLMFWKIWFKWTWTIEIE